MPMGENKVKDSQFWSWTDHWEGWDFMSDDQEEKIRAEEWGNEWFWDLDPLIDEQDLRIIMICMECGNPLEGCICEDAVPTPPPSESLQHPFQ